MLKKVACVTALAVVGLFAGGCAMDPTVQHRKEISIKGRLLLVPFRDAKNYYYDSEDGGAIIDGAVIALKSKAAADISVVDYEKARGLIREAYALNENIGWRDIGETVGADYVLYGSVDAISWVDPSTPGIPRCSFSVTYHILDIAKNRVIYGANKTGQYPVTLVGNWADSYLPDTEGLKPRAFLYIGRTVANTFYTATADRREEGALLTQELK